MEQFLKEDRQLFGRFAPTPTGPLHVGNGYTAILSWVASRSLGEGQLLRIDDLDLRALPAGCLDAQLSDLAWLELDYDESPALGGAVPPYRQSERSSLYQSALAHLNELGLLYPCTCSRREVAAYAPHDTDGVPIYQGHCRPKNPTPLPSLSLPPRDGRRPALRINLPAAFNLLKTKGSALLSESGAVVSFQDAVWGRQSYALNTALGDFVLRRGDGVYAYQLACAVDDGLQSAGLIVRGADLLSSTARQLIIIELLGLPRPRYAHCALIVDDTGERLAKRRESTTLAGLNAAGVSSAALRAYLSTLWGGPGVSDWRALIESFSLTQLPKTPARWDPLQLNAYEGR
ncbi:MAG: glutamate--tRNA ligase family protein [Myxococcota bacterium]|nr:glutamate--tRNA ligase family protein [Myxococcota bacterium]